MTKLVVLLVFVTIAVCCTWGEQVQFDFEENTHQSPRSFASFLGDLLARSAKRHGDYALTSNFDIARDDSPTFSLKRSSDESTSNSDDSFIPFVARQLEPSPVVSPEFLSPEPSPSESVSVSATPSSTPSVLASQSRTPTSTPTSIPSEVPVSPSPTHSIGATPNPCTCPQVVIMSGAQERGDGFNLVHFVGTDRIFRVKIFITERKTRPGNRILRVVVRAAGESRFPKLIRARVGTRPRREPYAGKGQLPIRSDKNPGRYVRNFDIDESNYCLGNNAGYPRTVGAWGRAKYKDTNGKTRFTNRFFTRSFRLICKSA